MKTIPRLLPTGPLAWLLLLLLAGTSARADIWNVSLDTSQLGSSFTGPFGIDFELVGSNGSTITLSNFSFGTGGSAGPGSPYLTGGASGDLTSGVGLADASNFFSDFNQQFTPGSLLSFTVNASIVAPPAGGSPDDFTMVIFYGYDPTMGYNPAGTGAVPPTVPTGDPSGADTLLDISLGGPGATTATGYSGTGGTLPVTITPLSVPEPSSAVLLGLGLAGLLAARCRSVSVRSHSRGRAVSARRSIVSEPVLPSTRER